MEPSTYSASPPSVLDMALAMAEAGYAIAPVRITLKPDGRKSPDYGGLPWASISTHDQRIIREWFGPGGRYAGWSYLVDTGKSGIVVVDLDTTNGHDGPGAWQALGGLSSMMSVRTRAGGFHGFYRADPDIPLYNSTSAVADGVDIRGIGGCVFGPGSFVEGHADQVYRLLSTAPIPVDRLPVAPANVLENAMAARGRARCVPDGLSLHIQREQAYANLMFALDTLLTTPIGYGLNTAIWRLGAEAGQYGGALGADEATVLAWAHEMVLRHPQIDELDGDDLRASQRGVATGMEKPWIFFTLQDLIQRDFTDAGMPLPAPGGGLAGRVFSIHEMASRPKPVALVEGLVDVGRLAMIFGPGGSGKSFIAVDLACCVASGQPWHGRSVTAGRVLYVAGEGGYGLPERVRAWAIGRGVAQPDIDVVDGAVDLVGQVNAYDVSSVAAFVAERGHALVVLDTYNRCTPGLEENSAKETGLVVSKLAEIQAAGAAVLIVHHTPKDSATPRGSAALEWATDHAIRVEKKDSALTVVNHRQKDRPDGDVFSLVLAAVNGTDSAALMDGAIEAKPASEPAYDVWTVVTIGEELEAYEGSGAALVMPLSQFMGQRARSGVGITRTEAGAALGRKHSDGLLRNAWNVLYVQGALRTADGSRSPVGRCLWVPPGELRHAELMSRD